MSGEVFLFTILRVCLKGSNDAQGYLLVAVTAIRYD